MNAKARICMSFASIVIAVALIFPVMTTASKAYEQKCHVNCTYMVTPWEDWWECKDICIEPGIYPCCWVDFIPGEGCEEGVLCGPVE